MRRIDIKVQTVLETGRFGRHSVLQVAADKGRRIGKYQELVDLVAEIAYRNPQFTLLFRGQHEDYGRDDRPGQISSLFPSSWRLGPRGRGKAREHLRQWSERVRGLAILSRSDKRRLRAIQEGPWAMLQHYSSVTRCETPLLDVTESLRVAASFATQGYLGKERNANLHGVVFVFGFPAIHQGTTISLDDGLILLRLTSVCPQAARRPHFQSGYLVGTYPTDSPGGKKYKNFSLRLIGKLRISTDASFWDVDTPLCQQALFPDTDALGEELAEYARSASEIERIKGSGKAPLPTVDATARLRD